jgi:hypothetical protein
MFVFATKRFVKEIPDLLKVHPLPPHVVVDRCIALEVRVCWCLLLQDLVEICAREGEEDSGGRVL